jgi:hypothetical protein
MSSRRKDILTIEDRAVAFMKVGLEAPSVRNRLVEPDKDQIKKVMGEMGRLRPKSRASDCRDEIVTAVMLINSDHSLTRSKKAKMALRQLLKASENMQRAKKQLFEYDAIFLEDALDGLPAIVAYCE